MHARSDKFTLDDFMGQMDRIENLGPMEDLMRTIPGMMETGIQPEAIEKGLRRTKAIYNSMSRDERMRPDLLNGERGNRVARGAGTDVVAVSQFLKQFEQARAMMQRIRHLGPEDFK